MPRYIKNVEQQRAKSAYKCVEDAITKYGQKSKPLKEYKSYVRSIPMMIKNNGLSNAFAFVLSKSKDGNAYALIDAQMREWFKDKDKITTETSFVQYLITLESVEYRRMTVEVFAFFTWLKRFADGLIETEEDNTEQKKEKEIEDAN